MKIDFKQTIVRLLFSEKIFLALLAGGVFVLLFSSVSFAPTKMTDSDLNDVQGQALFSITQYTNSTMSSGGWGGNGQLQCCSHIPGHRYGNERAHQVFQIGLL